MIKKEEEKRTFELDGIDKLDELGPVFAIPWTKEALEIFGKLRKYQLEHNIDLYDFTEEMQAKVLSGEID